MGNATTMPPKYVLCKSKALERSTVTEDEKAALLPMPLAAAATPPRWPAWRPSTWSPRRMANILWLVVGGWVGWWGERVGVEKDPSW